MWWLRPRDAQTDASIAEWLRASSRRRRFESLVVVNSRSSDGLTDGLDAFEALSFSGLVKSFPRGDIMTGSASIPLLTTILTGSTSHKQPLWPGAIHRYVS